MVREFVDRIDGMHELARLGVAAAQFALGLMYQDGVGVAADKAKAAEWYRKAAEQGDVGSQYNLAQLYVNDGDSVEAAKWFRRAAELGHAGAQYNYGCLCALGQGVKQDFRAAAGWFYKAADAGLAEAQYTLGDMHMRGEHTCPK